jgi:hypothetical protein
MEPQSSLPFLAEFCRYVLWQQASTAMIASYPVTSLFPFHHALIFLPAYM